MIDGKVFANAAVELAGRVPAIPYVMGGTTPKGMDCRGLVVYLLRQMGHPSYRTAGATSMWDDDCGDYQKVGQADLRPGDLLFIRAGEVSEHMGVYCGAPGCEVVHASASKGCVCASTVKNGWTHVARHRLVASEAAREEPTERQTRVVCAQGGLRQRETPGGRYMQMIPDGARVEVGEIRDGWGRVGWRGHTGWVSLDYLGETGED